MILRELTFSPGYSDMRGASHSEKLEKNKEGGWVITCSDREYYSAPNVVTTYEVSSEAVSEFEAFLKEENVLSLTDRKRSDDFATDYSPWEFRILFEDTTLEKPKRAYYSISEYKRYSKEDHILIQRLRDRFRALRGRMISEVAKKDE